MREYPMILGLLCVAISAARGAEATGGADLRAEAARQRLLRGEFRWVAGEPLINPVVRPEMPCIAVKDPSVVFHDGRWHVFYTIRVKNGPVSTECLSFKSRSAAGALVDWKDADRAERHALPGISDGHFCAPEVFYFRPQKKWYMICQGAIETGEKPVYGPAYSTTSDIADPTSWTKPTLLTCEKPADAKAWLDFWVICDAKSAWLYFTSLDGRLWRCRTDQGAFPAGWSKPEIALQGDIFEASHTYRLKGMDKYLTLIEAQKGRPGWRYYKAYLADSLDGKWEPLAATAEKPFAGLANVRFSGGGGISEVSNVPPPINGRRNPEVQCAAAPGNHWTDSFSHGELLRDGNDETLTVDPAALRFLIQGVTDADREGKAYGAIPWRLGILEPD